MKYILIGILLVISIPSSQASQPLSAKQIDELLEHPSRYLGDSDRDGDRKPGAMLDFMDIAPGQTVLDLYAGGGWYTELFSLAVGDTGKIYAQNDQLTWRFGGKEMVERTDSAILKNVHLSDDID